jgi:hypothetical protein
VHPRLPQDGGGGSEWQGLVPNQQVPHAVDFSRGWLANWNNLPSAGWTNGDAEALERVSGPMHRVRILELLVATIAVGAYLWVTTVRWQRNAAEWEEKAHAYAEEVASLRMQLDGASSELEAARDQLSTATSRITDLANEKAQLGDENVASQQYLDYQKQVSTAAATVASALRECVSGQ